ncbi:MAG: Flp pilus assembly complex ATPase component TadA, partial [candidate division Zixibacteria bacterium]|nr:Flp pilus assembly complex ATPase component TadA [candidate division Zixibacteria bacterium]
MVKKKIGDLLVEKNLITRPQLDECLRDQAISGRRIGEILVDRGYITELQLIETISERLSIPKVNLDSMVIDPRVIQIVPVDIARRYSLIPVFAIGNTLTLVMSDPLNIIAIDEIKYLTGKNIKRSIATTTEIVRAIDQYYSVADSLHQIVQSRQKDEQVVAVADVPKTASDTDSPIIRLVDLIISKAVKDKASDIHIEPEEDRLRIRYRISNVMQEEASPPKSMQNELISRVKISANLDVSEKRLPQDGRFGVNIDGASIDLRVSSLPTIHG